MDSVLHYKKVVLQGLNETIDGGFAMVENTFADSPVAIPTLLKISSASIAITGINPEVAKSEMNISIYPNPSKDYFTLKSNSELRSCTIELFNSQGQLVRNYSEFQGTTLTIQRNNLSAGLYLLKIRNQAGIGYISNVMLD